MNKLKTLQEEMLKNLSEEFNLSDIGEHSLKRCLERLSNKSYTLGMMKGVESSNDELELLKLAKAELLDLRGMLCDFRGTFDPNMQKLKKYWSEPKPEWEVKLSKLKQELK